MGEVKHSPDSPPAIKEGEWRGKKEMSGIWGR